jgi:glycogen synthase
MIACRYGTIPIGRKTGGLKDTIFDIGDNTVPLSQRNGLVFSSYEWGDLEKSLDKAIELFHGDLKWTLLKNALSSDFSWKNSTKAYLELYTS